MTKEELQSSLEDLKKGLECAITEKNKTEISTRIKGVEHKIKAFDTLKTEIEEIKAANVTRDERDKKNQDAIDKLTAKGINIDRVTEKKSFGEMLMDGITENNDDFQKFLRKERKSFSFQMKAVADMGFAGNFGTASQSVSNVRPGIILNPDRKLHVRELVPQGTMDGSTFYYVKENGAGEGSIATVAENATKPQIDLDLIEA